jgi:hypothetical protein
VRAPRPDRSLLVRPRFNDDKGLLALVEDEFLKQEMEAALLEYPDDMTWSDIAPSAEEIERKAVEEARRENFKLMADLVRAGRRLNAEARELIADYLRGKRKRGRPPMTKDERRVRTPVHGAADEIQWIAAILREHYPDQRKIRDRAIDIAALRVRINRNTLANYLKSKRRIRHHL